MRDSWLDTYTGGEDPPTGETVKPEKLGKSANILAIAFAIGLTATLIGGSLWMQMKDSQNAMSHMLATQSQSLKDRAAAMLVLDKDTETVAQTISKLKAAIDPEEESLMLQSISDLGETGKLDPFAPLVAGPGEASFDPTKPKDILDNVLFTGFINDTNAKEKVAVIRIGDSIAGSITVVKKIGETFYLEDQKVMIKDIKAKTLYLSIAGARRTLSLTPYVDTVLAKGSSGGSPLSGPGTGAVGSSGVPTSSGNLELEEI